MKTIEPQDIESFNDMNAMHTLRRWFSEPCTCPLLLVGPPLSGKTTIVYILSNLYPDDTRTIIDDVVDHEDLPPSASCGDACENVCFIMTSDDDTAFSFNGIVVQIRQPNAEEVSSFLQKTRKE